MTRTNTMAKGFLIWIVVLLMALALMPSPATTASGFANAPKWGITDGFNIPLTMLPLYFIGLTTLVNVMRKLR